jgi:5-formyltetrahydrofolate cyclo-ligase
VTKGDIRNKYRELRKKILPQDKLKYEKIICEKTLNFEAILKADAVFAYLSLPEEVETRSIIEALLEAGKKVAIPKVFKKNKTMEFYRINNLVSDITQGEYGIYEPCKTLEKFRDFRDAIILVPALAFDVYGNRIGFGAGYYDKFLDGKTNLLKIGLCFNSQISQGPLPASEHDIKTDVIISEKEIIKITKI